MQHYLVTAAEMKQYDSNTIEHFHYPALLLMERAALATVEAIREEYGMTPCRVLVVAGCGNNGGDGLAVGRLLMLSGYEVTYVMPGRMDKCSEQTKRQLSILQSYGVSCKDRIPGDEYDIVIDAIFGIGLSRKVEGIYEETIRALNAKKGYVCSIDMPSGIHTDSGAVMGCAVKADLTITYGFYKLGQMLFPGCLYCGKTVRKDMGIDSNSFLGRKPAWYTYGKMDQICLPARRTEGNKGTFGKVLIIAGNHEICGAAMLAAKSCFRIGAGMVKIVTAVENREALQEQLPEAMLSIYEKEMNQDEEWSFWRTLQKDFDWADCILIGSGIGQSAFAMKLVEKAVLEEKMPLVMDADGLNLLAQDISLQEALNRQGRQGRTVIVTPHLGEFARIYDCSITQAKENLTCYPVELAERLQAVVVCKDARTVVTSGSNEASYLNITGNEGMATAGMGDVLAGMITGLLAQGYPPMEAAVNGVYLHGKAGDRAGKKRYNDSIIASDVIEQVSEVLKETIREKRELV